MIRQGVLVACQPGAGCRSMLSKSGTVEVTDSAARCQNARDLHNVNAAAGHATINCGGYALPFMHRSQAVQLQRPSEQTHEPGASRDLEFASHRLQWHASRLLLRCWFKLLLMRERCLLLRRLHRRRDGRLRVRGALLNWRRAPRRV